MKSSVSKLSLSAATLLLAGVTLGACEPDYPYNTGYGYDGGYGYGAPAYGYPGDVSAEDAYWRSNYYNEPYYVSGYGYDDYAPAYSLGVDFYNRYPDRRFEDIHENELRARWQQTHGNSHLDWSHAREAARAGYVRASSEHRNYGDDRDHPRPAPASDHGSWSSSRGTVSGGHDDMSHRDY